METAIYVANSMHHHSNSKNTIRPASCQVTEVMKVTHTSPRALVVEQKSIAGEDAIGLAVVDNYPVGIEFSSTCTTYRYAMEREIHTQDTHTERLFMSLQKRAGLGLVQVYTVSSASWLDVYWVCCVALFCCLFDLACFFLPLHFSNMYIHGYTHTL